MARIRQALCRRCHQRWIQSSLGLCRRCERETEDNRQKAIPALPPTEPRVNRTIWVDGQEWEVVFP
jgi:hypothetical protein